jgi:hypothetical protein
MVTDARNLARPRFSTGEAMASPTGIDPSRQVRPAGRYRTSAPWVRPLVVAAVALLAVAFGAWLVWAGLHHANPEVSARVTGFRVADDNTVRVTVQIERAAGQAVTCLVRAQAADHAIVGEREVVVPAGGDTSLQRTVVVRTERPATTGVLGGCRTTRDPSS